MSGSGGGGSSGGPDQEPTPCEMLAFETQLSSPQPAVVKTIQVGEVLDVKYAQSGSVQTIQVLKKGQLAGGLTATSIARLRECILQGVKYKATVTAVSSGQVKVRVTAV